MMKPCTCGKEVALRAMRIRVNRHQGVAHRIEHMDGTKVCRDGDWTCCAMKPYPKKVEDKEYSILIRRWQSE